MAKVKKEKTEVRKAALVKPAKKTVAKAAAQKTAKKAALKVAAIVRPVAAKAKKAAAATKISLKAAVKKKEAVVTVLPPVKEMPALKVTEPLKPQEPIKPKIVTAPIPPQVAPPVKVVPPAVPPAAPKIELKELELNLPISVKDLAIRLQEKPSVLIKMLMDRKVMVGINKNMEEPVVVALCEKLGFRIKKAPGAEELALGVHEQKDRPQDLKPRSPVVTFMGHVDHGKTSLLDAIRKTKVAESEHGGITQHIGAYRVSLAHGDITFLDTPGHEAFTAMRARGASVTDIVVLVVAADDGIMPQTEEAIDHARAAGVAIIVAVNKVDKPQANVDQVKKQLSKLDLMSEDWGGKTITVPVSAKTGQGIDNLLEMILLEAQMLELKANPERLAKGVVLEAKLSKGRGPVATLLVQNGALRLNENIIAGKYYGKIRAMFNDCAQAVTSAGPSVPVEILGLTGVPQAGEQFFAIEDEKTAKELAAKRQDQERQLDMKAVKRISLEDLYSQIKEGKLKELKLVIKSDVRGSLEAIKDTLNKMNVSEIKLSIIHEGVGDINSSDVILAAASNALVLGFHVESDERAKELVAQEGVEIRTYNIIYELANDVKAALEGMLEPKLKKVFLGKAEIRKVFKVSRSGTIAGSFILKGKIIRSASVDLVRNGEVVFEGSISSLKRFKDDVREVAEGFECGIALGGFDDYKEGDIIEAYEIEKIARKL
ncbi:translation initiation factor IF-2 [bacterium]|nr:MAG: translation initiation factor IF-2 [bacterium]